MHVYKDQMAFLGWFGWVDMGRWATGLVGMGGGGMGGP